MTAPLTTLRQPPATRRVPFRYRLTGIGLLVLAADLAYLGVVAFFGGRPEANAHPFIRHGGEGWY